MSSPPTRGKAALRHLLYGDEEKDIPGYDTCERCENLCRSRTNVAFGSGSSTADILIVGEAPGEQEDIEGVPFVGRSGNFLLQLLEKVWDQDVEELTRIRQIQKDDEYYWHLRNLVEARIFFTNVVLCRPEDNRTPSTQEIKNCRERLHRTIYAVDPKLIIAAGKTAASALLGKNVPIMRRRGELFDISITSPSTDRKVRYPMFALLHPSFLLRTGDKSLVRQKTGNTYATMQDLTYALSLLNEYDRIAQGALP